MSNQIVFPETIPPREILRAIGASETKLNGLLRTTDFPKPMWIGRERRWVKSEVQAWLDARLADRENQAA